MFYERLFTIAPEVRAVFKGDIGAQGRKLMETLGARRQRAEDMPTACRRS